MENGALFTIEANFNIHSNAGGSKLDIYGQNSSVYSYRTLSQVEDGGTLTYTYNCVENEIMKSENVDYVPGNMYTKEVDAFSKAIMENTDVPVSAESGIYAQKLVEAIYESADTGRKIIL